MTKVRHHWLSGVTEADSGREVRCSGRVGSGGNRPESENVARPTGRASRKPTWVGKRRQTDALELRNSTWVGKRRQTDALELRNSTWVGKMTCIGGFGLGPPQLRRSVDMSCIRVRACCPLGA